MLKESRTIHVRWLTLFIGCFCCLLILGACSNPNNGVDESREVTVTPVDESDAAESTEPSETDESAETAEPAATPTPTGVTLSVCVPNEPTTLYRYSQHGVHDQNRTAAEHIFSAIYEPEFYRDDFAPQPAGITTVPTTNNGGVTLTSVMVEEGDLVVDIDDRVVSLKKGHYVRTTDGESVMYAGEPLEVEQVTASFELAPRVWSDGEPVTAGDSVFAYEVVRDPDTVVSKYYQARTTMYRARGRDVVMWRGVPGYFPDDITAYVWPPLPRHQLEGMTAAELNSASESAELPLGDGAFRIVEWVRGESITVEKNPHYAGESAAVDRVVYQFVPAGETVEAVLAGQCDVATADAISSAEYTDVQAAVDEGALVAYPFDAPVWEQLSFSVAPEPIYSWSRPDWFGDVRVRQAIAQCVDREQMLAAWPFADESAMRHSYTAPEHPLYSLSVTEWRYDVEAANVLLDKTQFRDYDEDGMRESGDGVPFAVVLLTTEEDSLRVQVAEQVRDDLVACGIDVEVETLPSATLLSPQGPIFRRRFDLALFGWWAGGSPACHLFTTAEIPTSKNLWQGQNVTGWSGEAFSLQCETAQLVHPGSVAHGQAHRQAQIAFADAVPTLPILTRPRVMVARPAVGNIAPNVTQPSSLWNIAAVTLVRDSEE